MKTHVVMRKSKTCVSQDDVVMTSGERSARTHISISKESPCYVSESEIRDAIVQGKYWVEMMSHIVDSTPTINKDILSSAGLFEVHKGLIWRKPEVLDLREEIDILDKYGAVIQDTLVSKIISNCQKKMPNRTKSAGCEESQETTK